MSSSWRIHPNPARSLLSRWFVPDGREIGHEITIFCNAHSRSGEVCPLFLEGLPWDFWTPRAGTVDILTLLHPAIFLLPAVHQVRQHTLTGHKGHADRKHRGSANGDLRSVAEQGTKLPPGNAIQPSTSPCRPQLLILCEPLSPRKTFNWGVKLFFKTDERDMMRDKGN